MPTHPTLDDILKARRFLDQHLSPTPMYRSAGFSETLGLELHVKYENFQPIRSFKVRGGLYTMSLLDLAQCARGVTTASTGNHGQGIAYGGGVMGIPVKVVVPHGTPEVKSDAIRRLGAELVVHGETIADGFARSREIAEETGMVYIEDGEDFGLMAGAGTIGLEIMEDLPDVDTVVLPVGGGNLIAGVGTAIKATHPDVRLIGVQASNAPSVYRSWQEGRTVTTATCDTFAGGLATTYPGGLAFDVLRDRVDEMHLVSEEEMKRAIPVVLEHTGFIAEGAAAAVFALCMREAAAWRGRRVASLFSGGNLGMDGVREMVQNLKE
ncbi:MAG: threonine/serine dehydratase [Gemmatimonadetes bacterium]|nr:threonine/serine dehydratase [Gemmatimonadota bacterium]MYJ91028.1 threonine/serine dehydratase [Gemmatimonadota bacterium]